MKPLRLPLPEELEFPIIQELSALGGRDSPANITKRVSAYFPSLWCVESEPDLRSSYGTTLLFHGSDRWLERVRQAAKGLIEKGELSRDGGDWTLTPRCERRLQDETMRLDETPSLLPNASSHLALQHSLVQLGEWLGYYAKQELDTYDVVWSETSKFMRYSHVFEVQVKGSVDSALARLKQAHTRQRSRLFFVVANERSTEQVEKRLESAFPELQPIITIIGRGALERLFGSLASSSELLHQLARRD